MQRRHFLQTGSALGAMGLMSGCATMGGKGPHVVVVGGGYAGATAAKYIRMWSDQSIQVTLVEPNPAFISCPISNLVIGGSKTITDITTPYDNLVKRHGVKMVQDRVSSIDADKRIVKLAGGTELTYDRLIVSPGVDFMWETLPGMNKPGAQDKVLHAWKAGAQTVALRKQLEAMPDGGVFAMSIPLAPYRCPPGPYERACQVAEYFSKAKPKSKVLILDANDDVTSKGPLFKKAWAERYKGIVEYRGKHNVTDVDVANKRWCDVDFLTFESKVAKNVHVLGDAIQIAPAMPKSGHMANQHGKTCAAAVVALLTGKEVNTMPIYNNTCYSFVSSEDVVHVASVHAYDADKKTMLTVPGSGGVSSAANELEGRYAMAWARNIWADTLA